MVFFLGLSIVSIVSSPTRLLGLDPLLLERNTLKNFAHADDARSKRKGRQLTARKLGREIRWNVQGA